MLEIPAINCGFKVMVQIFKSGVLLEINIHDRNNSEQHTVVSANEETPPKILFFIFLL